MPRKTSAAVHGHDDPRASGWCYVPCPLCRKALTRLPSKLWLCSGWQNGEQLHHKTTWDANALHRRP